MKSKTIAIALCVATLICLLICPLGSFAQSEEPKVENEESDILLSATSDSGNEKSNEESEEGIDISFYRIKYCGGLVTFFFGNWAKAYDQESGKEFITSEVNIPIFLVATLICGALAYFLCSINPEIILSKKLYGVDVRTQGSKSASAANMKRLFGWKSAILSVLFDALKASVAVFIALLVGGEYCAYFAAIFCIVGHSTPIFHQFHGGKGTTCAIAAIAIIEPIVALILFVVFAIIVIGTKYVSLGAIMTSLLYPLFLRGSYGIIHSDVPSSNMGIPVLAAFIMTIVVLILHRKNIKRLLAGEEFKFSFKKGGTILGSDERAEDEEKKSKK